MSDFCSDEGRMTADKVQKICKQTGGYNTRCLNEKLYLHFKGWPRIENLDEFTGARVIWLEGNGLRKIEGLYPCAGLRQIYLQQNCLQKIENLEGFNELRCLNLAENFISKIENLSCVPLLETLQLSNNSITTYDDLEHLCECMSIRVLELAKNKIEDPRIVDVLETLPELKVLKLDGNPVVRKIPAYRKTLICRLKNLTYLDDRPVFEEERMTAEAWMRGGIEAEKIERQRQRAAKRAAEDRRHKAFFKMVEDAKKQRRAQKDRHQNVQNSGAVENDDKTTWRDQQQTALVDKLENDLAKSKRVVRRDGKRRTRCIIEEVENTTTPTRTKCTFQEVVSNKSQESNESLQTGGRGGSVHTGHDSSSTRKAKSRKEREDRLRQAMAAVDAERKLHSADDQPKQITPVVQKSISAAWTETEPQVAPAPRFANLDDQEVAAELLDEETWADISNLKNSLNDEHINVLEELDFEELD